MYAFSQQLDGILSIASTRNEREVTSEMAIGNAASSTEPQSGEGSPLDWIAPACSRQGCKPRGSINFLSNEEPR
jgi:hypothetical protein